MGRRPNKINNANISVDAKIIGFSERYDLNERFEVRKVSVLSWDEYGNRFHFSKPLIDSKDYQLDMLPVVGFHDGDGFTSHDDRAVPYGAIIPNSARWETVEDKEYKVVDVAFWKGRYSELNDLKSCNQSMELVGISGTYNKEMGIFEAEDYTYDALCVLNENVKPAYSKARVFNLSDIKDEFNIFKEEFNALFNANKIEEGGGLVDNEQLEPIKEDTKNEDENLDNNNESVNSNDKNNEGDEPTDSITCKTSENMKQEPDNEIKDNPENVVNYQELYETLQISFNELTENYSVLKEEVEVLRQFKDDVEEAQAKEKAEMELQTKNEELEKFSAKLSKKEILEEIDDVNNFSLEEIRTKLSVVLANKLLSENTTFNEDKIINIDNADKTYSRSERLLAELKNKKNN